MRIEYCGGEKMAVGTLTVYVTVAQQALPLSGTRVTTETETKLTDDNGYAVFEGIEAPDPALSLDPDNTIVPYSTVNVTTERENY